SAEALTDVLSTRPIPFTTRYYRVGEGLSPWRSASGDLVIEALPGSMGQYIARPLTPSELTSLSQHFEGVEFGLASHLNVQNERIYMVFSGEAGQLGQARVPIVRANPLTGELEPAYRGATLHYHTHPAPLDAAAHLASNQDQMILRALGQEYS